MGSPKNQPYVPHVPRVRCPRFLKCKARLCPLDPFLTRKKPLRDEELCSFYTESGRLEHLNEIPWFLFSPLLDYARRLAEIGLVVGDDNREA